MSANKAKLLITTGIYPPEAGGPAVYVAEIAQALVADFQVKVVTYSASWSRPADRALSYRLVRIWRHWPVIWRQLVYFCRVFSGTVRADRVLVLNVMDGGVPVWLAAKLFRKAYSVRISGDRVWEMAARRGKTKYLIDEFQRAPKGLLISQLFKLQAIICQQADVVIAHSRYLVKLAEGWGVPPERIQLIYSGFSFQPASLGREAARIKLGIPGNIIISWGRLVPWKGFRMLIKLMPQLLAVNPFFRLVIIGDGPEMPTLKQMVKNLKLEKKVYLLGAKRREDLAVYLAAADLFVYNTAYEGLSHQILEALAAGVPVITTNIGGNPELIKQGENGFLLKYNDEFNLLEAIKTLWRRPELREQFSAAGRITAQRFTVEKMVTETRNLWH